VIHLTTSHNGNLELIDSVHLAASAYIYHVTKHIFEWAVLDSNQRPLRCQRNALTS
ncbi:uncharacterized protein METZ01_LOCUS283107, partial [marine metagenome]